MENNLRLKFISAVVALVVLVLVIQEIQILQIQGFRFFASPDQPTRAVQLGESSDIVATVKVSPVEFLVSSVAGNKIQGTAHYFVSNSQGDFERNKKITLLVDTAQVKVGSMNDIKVGARIGAIVAKESPEESDVLTVISFDVYPAQE